MSDPNMHYDGQRWLRYDGTQWLDATTGQPAAGAPAPSGGGSKMWWWIGGAGAAFVVLILIIAAVGSSGSKPQANTSASPAPVAPTATAAAPTPPPAPAPASNDLNKPVRDGDFEFVVTSAKIVGPTVGTGYSKEKAQGTFFEATMSVKNIGDSQGSFFADNQKALNASNQQYAASFAASIVANGNASTIFSQINPGNSVTGKVVWDVPKGTTITKLELHDSAFSGGVTVNLG